MSQKNGKFALRADIVVEMKVYKVADEVANMVVDRESSHCPSVPRLTHRLTRYVVSALTMR